MVMMDISGFSYTDKPLHNGFSTIRTNAPRDEVRCHKWSKTSGHHTHIIALFKESVKGVGIGPGC